MIDKTRYQRIEIPEDLHAVVQEAIAEGQSKRKKTRVLRFFKRAGSVAAALMLCMIAALNLSPSFAMAACDLPVVGDLCRVFLFREFHTEDAIQYIDARIPQIENTGNTELEARVNQEIRKVIEDCLTASEARAREYYDAFVETGGKPEDFIPVGITISYETKHVSPQYLSFVVSQHETRFDAYNRDFYYNMDLKSGKVLTLRDWFGLQYRKLIAKSIKDTIAGWSEEQRSILWDDLSIVDLISESTPFYLNADGQIVVVIEKYEAAYGAAGNLEFTIAQPPQA